MWDVVHHFVDVIVCTAWQFFAEFQVKAFYVNSCDMLRAVTMIFRSYCVEKVKSLMSNLLPEEMVSVVRTIATEKCVGRSISKVSAWLRENVTIGKKSCLVSQADWNLLKILTVISFATQGQRSFSNSDVEQRNFRWQHQCCTIQELAD